MSRTLCYLILLGLLISCHQQNNKTAEALDTVKLSSQPAPKNTLTNSSAEENDCVFNNDRKGLTESWLKELKITNFIWRADLYRALIPRGQDTIFISQGGCVHFGIMVEIKLMNDNHALTDSSYFIKKALQLATEFKMDYYEQVINERKIKKSQARDTSVWYEVPDSDPEDNLYYNGIEITSDGKNKKINLSLYFN